MTPENKKFKPYPYFDVVEYFKGDKLMSRRWTVEGMKPEGTSKAEVIKTLEMMLEDCKKHNSFTEKEKI